jgi:hypothetical protein
VSSVFPLESQRAKQEQMKQLQEAVGLGEGRFITEKQVGGKAVSAPQRMGAAKVVVTLMHAPNASPPALCHNYATMCGDRAVHCRFPFYVYKKKSFPDSDPAKRILQLEELKKTRGGTVEDGSVVRDKTLAAILAENKEKKEEEFQNVWKSMKQGTCPSLWVPWDGHRWETDKRCIVCGLHCMWFVTVYPLMRVSSAGKNRPLDEDDMAFVTRLQDSEHAKEESLKIAEQGEIASFQEVPPSQLK